jgi:hypothetical protein
MLSETIYTIDDIMTTAALGAATPNQTAYTYDIDQATKVLSDTDTGQLVMQDEGKTEDNTYIYYRQGGKDEQGNSYGMHDGVYYNEQSIVMSEANSLLIYYGMYNTGTKATDENLVTRLASTSENDTKSLESKGFNIRRIGYSDTAEGLEIDLYTAFKEETRKIIKKDSTETNSYTLQCINNLMDIMSQNISNSTISLNEKLTELTGKEQLKKFLTLDKSEVINNTFVGKFVADGIEVTRLEIYNIYRYTLAKRHVYASPFMTYKLRFWNKDTNTYDEYTTSWDGYDRNHNLVAKDSNGKCVAIKLDEDGNITGIKEYTSKTYTVTDKDGNVTVVASDEMEDGWKTLAAKDWINLTYNDLGVDITVVGWFGPTTEDELKNWIQQVFPAMVIPGKVPEWLKITVPGSSTNSTELWLNKWDKWYTAEDKNSELANKNYNESTGENKGNIKTDSDTNDDTATNDYSTYYLMYSLWMTDYNAWLSREDHPLVFWEDTGITYQSDWWEKGNTYRDYYGYLWNNESLCAVKITDSILIKDTFNDGGERLLIPIEGYSTYIYVEGSEPISTYVNRAKATESSDIVTEKIGSETYSYYYTTSLNMTSRDAITIGDANEDGTLDDYTVDTSSTYYKKKRQDDITFSAVYLETKYTLATFPSELFASFNTKEVRAARLITVTQQ